MESTFSNSPRPEGTPTWIAINTPDMAKAGKFYEDLFGWKIETPSPGHPDFLLAKKKDHYIAGILLNKDDSGSQWITYLATDDISKTIQKIRSNNGHILKDPITPTGEVSAITALATDPGGAEFGLWEAKSLVGMGAWEQDGGLMWSEQFSDQPEKCKEFYKAVFENIKYNAPISWHFGNPSAAIPGYTMYSTNGKDIGPYGQEAVGSIALLDSQDPIQIPHWMPCFATMDIHETTNTLLELGGEVLLPPYETMFGLLAIVTDNQGAAFMLAVKPNRE